MFKSIECSKYPSPAYKPKKEIKALFQPKYQRDIKLNTSDAMSQAGQ
jgi:hypothetical protein